MRNNFSNFKLVIKKSEKIREMRKTKIPNDNKLIKGN